MTGTITSRGQLPGRPVVRTPCAMSKTAYQRFVCIRDDFYEDLQKAYRATQTATYIEHEVATGLRSSTVYHEPGVRKKLERMLGLKITRWDTDPAAENGVFYIAAAHGRLQEKPGIHVDHPTDDVTVVIYLTPGLPPDCGTSLWQHRRTGLADAATRADARRLGMRYADLLDVSSVTLASMSVGSSSIASATSPIAWWRTPRGPSTRRRGTSDLRSSMRGSIRRFVWASTGCRRRAETADPTL